MKNSPPRIRPAPTLRAIAKRFWKEQVVGSDKQMQRLADGVREGFWEPVWESGKLRVKRHQTVLPGTAFGLPTPQGPTLGPPIIECDGGEITATSLTGGDTALDEVAEIMLKLVKLLKNQDRQSGWACVKVEGSSTAVQKLKKRIQRDFDAPAIWDPHAERALKAFRAGPN